MKKRASGVYGLEVRNKGLDGGRIDISLGVPVGATPGATARENKAEAGRREAAIRLLVERGEWQILRDLRAGKVQAVDIANAVRDGSVDALRRVGEVPLTLGAAIDAVLQEKRATTEGGTILHYEKVCRALQSEWGRDRELQTITADDARGWLYRRGWAANTQQGYHMVAGYVWRQAIAAEMEAAERLQARPRITRNVWDRVEARGERIRRHSFLEPAEWRDLLGAVEGRPQAAFLALGCLAGLRVQEALHLRTGMDVDLDGPDPMIRVQPHEGERSWRPKTDHSVRDIPIFPELRRILAEHRERYAGERYFIRPAGSDRPVSYTYAKQWTEAAFARAGLRYGREGEGLTYHSLRHSFASWLVREGWSSSLVARWLGNTAREVERTYAHLAPSDLHKIGAAVQGIVSGTDTVSPSNRPMQNRKSLQKGEG